MAMATARRRLWDSSPKASAVRVEPLRRDPPPYGPRDKAEPGPMAGAMGGSRLLTWEQFFVVNREVLQQTFSMYHVLFCFP